MRLGDLKSGKEAIVIGLAGMAVSSGLSFKDCFKSTCNETVYGAAFGIATSIFLAGMVLFYLGLAVEVRRSRKSKMFLMAVTAVYFLVGFGAYYYVFGGSGKFEAQSFKDNFQTPYYEAAWLPEEFTELYTSYSSAGEQESAYGPGNYSSTTFGKSVFASDGQEFNVGFVFEQGDRENLAARVFNLCRQGNECDTIDSAVTKDIVCRHRGPTSCATRLIGTYISITDHDSGISREDAILVIDSLISQ